MNYQMIHEVNKSIIKKVLIVQTAFLGDVILITPLIRAAKKTFINAEIDVIVINEYKDVLLNNPYIKNIIPFNKRNGKFKSSINLINQIRKIGYDIVLSPHSSLTTALILFFAGIKYRVGFSRWISQYFFNIKVEHKSGILKIKKNLNLLSPFSNEEFAINTELFPPREIIEFYLGELKTLKQSFKKLIAIAPGSVWKTKRWPKEYFKSLVNKLIDANYAVILLGSKDEVVLCSELHPSKNYLDLSGRLSVLESAAVIKLCDLMICNDSGAMHIANAVETDVFAIFGPTVEQIGYFPFRKNDFVFQNNLECRPCSSHGTNICKLKHHNCMMLTYPEIIFMKVIERFG